MLFTIAFSFFVVWVAAMITSQTLGGAAHLLLAAAAIVLVVRYWQNRPRPPTIDTRGTGTA